MSRRRVVAFVLIALTFASPTLRAQPRDAAQPAPVPRQQALSALLAAYPDFLDRVEGNELVWKDGTRMTIDDGRGEKSFDALLDAPDIKDMFAITYPKGEPTAPPPLNSDPGRIRYMPLFAKMYGDCRKRDVMADAIDVVWLPRKYGRKIKFTKINGAAAALQAASDELDALPGSYLKYLRPTAGTYNCRAIAGTSRLSAHGLGIAIDIAVAHSYYWRTAKSGIKSGMDTLHSYRNETPWEIVQIFERHGFIWGGKWSHYDTMHFEYRPEIIGAAR